MIRETDLQLSAKPERSRISIAGSGGIPSESRTLLLDPDMPTAQAFISIGLECLRHIASNQAAVTQGESEGIHQMRIGLRRLRVALSIFKHMLRRRDATAIKNKIKWLADQLAPARDYQVFLTDIFDQPHASRSEFEFLKADVRAELDLCLSTVKQIVGNDRFREFVVEIALWLLDGSWLRDKGRHATSIREMPLKRFARHELRKRARSVSRAARQVHKLTPLRRHKLRIATKKMRYTYGFFEHLITTKTIKEIKRDFVSELSSLQDKLGQLNDVEMQARLASELSHKLKDDEKAFALGIVIGRRTCRSRRLLRKAKKSGHRLYKLA